MECNYPGCKDPVVARQLCSLHYKRSQKGERARLKAKIEGATPILEWEAVYVMGARELPYVKVGRAKNIRDRYDQIQVGTPYLLRLYGAVFMPKWAAIAIEWEAHQALTEFGYHFRGEWFEVPPLDAVEVIKKCASMHGLPHSPGLEFAKELSMQASHMGYSDRRSVEWALSALKSSRIELGG